jgi:hypothetical protein
MRGREGYAKQRKALQSAMIGMGDQSPSWLHQFVKASISNFDFKAHLSNLIVASAEAKIRPATETGAASYRRNNYAEALISSYKAHKRRWFGSFDYHMLIGFGVLMI